MMQHGKLPPGSLFKPTLGYTCSSKPDSHPELPSEALTKPGKPSGMASYRSINIWSQCSQQDSPREPIGWVVGGSRRQPGLGEKASLNLTWKEGQGEEGRERDRWCKTAPQTCGLLGSQGLGCGRGEGGSQIGWFLMAEGNSPQRGQLWALAANTHSHQGWWMHGPCKRDQGGAPPAPMANAAAHTEQEPVQETPPTGPLAPPARSMDSGFP